VESLTSEPVVQDLDEGTVLVCVTEHPVLNAVCLQKWSLRLAADKYRKKNKETYKQTGSEERYMYDALLLFASTLVSLIETVLANH